MSAPSYPVSLPVGSKAPLATLHHPTSTLWEFEMHNGKDNRLTVTFLRECLSVALDIVEKDWRTQNGASPGGPGALIISGKQDQDKFFSNGLDFEAIVGDQGFFPNTFNPTIRKLLTFPIPTIAAINGHAFAAGFITTLACDYRVMQASKGWCSMNEILFGAPMPTSFAAIMRYKLPSPSMLRGVVMEAKRYTGKELLELGVVDAVADNGAGVMKAARELAAARGDLAKTGVWGIMKKDLMRETLKLVDADFRTERPPEEAAAAKLRLSKL
ncbi:ClpP/crotonase [Clavulina sp. PMI_390]|nr:ClpP/crotonase [Clavulina sp. PMI_390]